MSINQLENSPSAKRKFEEAISPAAKRARIASPRHSLSQPRPRRCLSADLLHRIEAWQQEASSSPVAVPPRSPEIAANVRSPDSSFNTRPNDNEDDDSVVIAASSRTPTATPSVRRSSSKSNSNSNSSKTAPTGQEVRHQLLIDGIRLRDRLFTLPPHQAQLARDMAINRDSPETKYEDNRQHALFQTKGAAETNVLKHYHKLDVLPDVGVEDDRLRCDDDTFFKTEILPSTAKARTRPDLAYGYDTLGEEATLGRLRNEGFSTEANANRLHLPFLIVEAKGDAPLSEPMYIATNQTLLNSAACVFLIERLRQRLLACDGSEDAAAALDETVFSIAMNGRDAQLYMTWREGGIYHSWPVESWSLARPRDTTDFRRHIRNICAWGTGKRKENIDEVIRKITQDFAKKPAIPRTRSKRKLSQA